MVPIATSFAVAMVLVKASSTAAAILPKVLPATATVPAVVWPRSTMALATALSMATTIPAIISLETAVALLSVCPQ